MTPVELEACLPAELRGPATTIARVNMGFSSAAVYRVDAQGGAFALKIGDAGKPLAEWQWRMRLQVLAGNAGLAPRVVHVDETRRAVVSVFVADLSFPALLGNPRTREEAIGRLGRMLRRVHDLPLPADAETEDTPDVLARVWSALSAKVPMPVFVTQAVERALAEPVPPCDRAAVLSHNDVNPSNLIFDGTDVMLLDWDAAGKNDPLYDLAAIAVFLRFDDSACAALLAAHDSAPVSALPLRFLYHRRLIAALCGVTFLRLASVAGHPGSTSETLETTASFGEIAQRMRSGAVNLGTADGKWAFGLGLVKASAAL